MGQEFVVSNEHTLKHTLSNIEKIYREKGFMKITYSTAKQRTLTQNAALHKFCELLASKLNESGLDMPTLLSHHADIPWNPHEVKERLWKPVQKALLDKKSTTEATKAEYSEVYEVLNRHLGEKYGVHVPWPSRGEADASS